MAKSLQDKVIIVTGAGPRHRPRGLHCSAPAEGAKVVVNGPRRRRRRLGQRARRRPEEVVEEIKKRGGTAIANFETVAEAIPASKIVKMATDHFGQSSMASSTMPAFLRDMIFSSHERGKPSNPSSRCT